MTKPFEDVSALLALIHNGDWDKTATAAQAVTESPVPTDVRELAEYIRRLRETLIAARAARANLVGDLSRLQAARLFSSPYQNGTAVPDVSTIHTSGGNTI